MSVLYSDDAGRVGRGREPELVVDDDVHGAADAVALDARQVERLGHHALAGERGVAVQQQRQHRERLGVVDAVLLGPHHALDDRIDGLEVRWVGGQLDGDLVAQAGDELAGLAEVVLHVARALGGVGVDVALELLEQLAVGLADDVGQHVEPAAVRHAEHRGVEVVGGGPLEDGVDQRDGRLGALDAEALLAEVLRAEELLEGLGRVEPVEDVALDLGLDGGVDALDLLLDPGLLLGLLDVHVLDAHRAAVGVAQHVEDVAERHPARRR